MTSSKKRGPDARAPDWHGDTAKYAAKMEHEKRERGELVVAIGPFCVPCGKRFAKQACGKPCACAHAFSSLPIWHSE
eukprot:6205753-Pleurochrysis_carterae.AAC.1